MSLGGRRQTEGWNQVGLPSWRPSGPDCPKHTWVFQPHASPDPVCRAAGTRPSPHPPFHGAQWRTQEERGPHCSPTTGLGASDRTLCSQFPAPRPRLVCLPFGAELINCKVLCKTLKGRSSPFFMITENLGRFSASYIWLPHWTLFWRRVSAAKTSLGKTHILLCVLPSEPGFLVNRLTKTGQTLKPAPNSEPGDGFDMKRHPPRPKYGGVHWAGRSYPLLGNTKSMM